MSGRDTYLARRRVAQKLIAELRRAGGYRLEMDIGTGAVYLWHGTSKKNAELILSNRRFNADSYFSHARNHAAFGSAGAADYAYERRGNRPEKEGGGIVMRIKVDPRDVYFNDGTGEFSNERELNKGEDGVWATKAHVFLYSMRNPEFDFNRAIEGLVGTLYDPIIVWPGGWDIPDWLEKKISLDRMIEEHKSISGGQPTAANSEVVAYLMTRSLAQPMDRDWHDIYLYTANIEFKREGAQMPGDIPVPTVLSNYQMGMLNDLKRWIYDQRLKNRAAKRRGEKLKDDKPPRPQAVVPSSARQTTTPSIKTEGERDNIAQVRKPWLPTGVKMWQVPLEQFLSWQKSRYPNAKDAEFYQWRMEHRRAVGQALRDKQKMPPAVLKDYPGLVQHPERGNNPSLPPGFKPHYIYVLDRGRARVMGMPIRFPGELSEMKFFMYQYPKKKGFEGLQHSGMMPKHLVGMFVVTEMKTGGWVSFASSPEQAYEEARSKLKSLGPEKLKRDMDRGLGITGGPVNNPIKFDPKVYGKWQKIEDSVFPGGGIYIGWMRQHSKIELRPFPYSKMSVVQISGRGNIFGITALTFAHSIFPVTGGKPAPTRGQKGLKLFERHEGATSLKIARRKAEELKKTLARRFDQVTRDTVLLKNLRIIKWK